VDRSSLPKPPPVPSPKSKVPSPKSPAPNPQHPAPYLVGRETELAQLHRWLEKALNGERQVVFIAGEPGIGKTTLVEAFLSGVTPNPQSVGRAGVMY
jgi:Cdc6-like AAA superfamily ATPase